MKDLVQTIETASLCPGNPDEKFVEMIKARHKQKVISVSGEVAAQVDSYPVFYDGKDYACILRTAGCSMLGDGNTCKKFRAQLRSMHSRHKKKGDENR